MKRQIFRAPARHARAYVKNENAALFRDIAKRHYFEQTPFTGFIDADRIYRGLVQPTMANASR